MRWRLFAKAVQISSLIHSRWSSVDLNSLNPLWLREISCSDFSFQSNRRTIIFSRILQRLQVRDIGLWLHALELFLLGLGIGITRASLYWSGKHWFSQIKLNMLRRYEIPFSGKFFMRLLGMSSGPGAELLVSARVCFNSSILIGLLIRSSLWEVILLRTSVRSVFLLPWTVAEFSAKVFSNALHFSVIEVALVWWLPSITGGYWLISLLASCLIFFQMTLVGVEWVIVNVKLRQNCLALSFMVRLASALDFLYSILSTSFCDFLNCLNSFLYLLILSRHTESSQRIFLWFVLPWVRGIALLAAFRISDVHFVRILLVRAGSSMCIGS